LNYTRVVDPWDTLPRGTVEQEDGEGVDAPPALGDLGGQDLNYTRVVDPWDMPPLNAATPDVAAPDAAVGGAAVGAAGDGLSIGETIEEASGPILDPPAGTGAAGEQAGGEAVDAALYGPGMGNPTPSNPAPSEPAAAPGATEAAGDAVEDETTNVYTDSDGKLWVDGDDYNRTVGEYNDLLEHTESQQQVEALGDAAEDVGESTVDFVEGIPIIGEDIGDTLREGYDVVEDVVDHADDPVVEDVDPWG
jgi:hypothetical protein